MIYNDQTLSHPAITSGVSFYIVILLARINARIQAPIGKGSVSLRKMGNYYSRRNREMHPMTQASSEPRAQNRWVRQIEARREIAEV